jgi:hypothetical protein
MLLRNVPTLPISNDLGADVRLSRDESNGCTVRGTMAGGIFPSGHAMMPCLPGFACVAFLNTTRPGAIASPRVGMGVHYRGYVVNIPLIGNNHACLTASLTAFSRSCESTGRRSYHHRLQDHGEKRV